LKKIKKRGPVGTQSEKNEGISGKLTAFTVEIAHEWGIELAKT